jgi:class 3 adenylate cyclase/tetratricopeptide (TPR) repeat protein
LEERVEAERRQVTVLFADMVGFTAFSEKSGEEAAFTLMRVLSKLMDEAVGEQGGAVRSFTGDGIMAVFGAPVAFEDAPLRACRAALSILQRLKTARPDMKAAHGVEPRLRIGLNTGTAVVGKVQQAADAAITVLGDTVNFAARLQALAEPDSVYMSEATHRLLQGLIDESFAGEHTVKGKSEPQKVYRLNSLRRETTRFEAAIGRGLSAFVGRERELQLLERALERARSQVTVVDLVAEAGMGKSRLLHEFRQRIGRERAFVLTGTCSPDGQQTPFFPFLEVVRGSFRISTSDAEKDIAQKLTMGLTALGLHSIRNVGLLLHLFGLRVTDDALVGLDGLLIGLRTRELLHQLLEARCRLSSVVMVIEDLHWIDSGSEELLDRIAGSESNLRLLLLTTHRPDYTPPWLNRSTVAKLTLDPLPTGDIRHLIQARLGVASLPEALARQVTEKSEGNPLFAEEIIALLSDRGIVRVAAANVDFDANAVGAALPPSLEGVLTARVDRLAPKDRALLQAASVIGRHFDPFLLASAVGEMDVEDRLAAMQALDLVSRDDHGSDYAFKHALVRDALYQSLLTDARKSLHLKIADEIERRSANRLNEVAELLARHYGQTDQAGKAFVYLSMAGSKNLAVYSFDEAAAHLNAARALIDQKPDCASDDQVTDFLISYAQLLHLSTQVKGMIAVLERYFALIDRLGDDPRAVILRHYYVLALIHNSRYREAAAIQRVTSALADRLGDGRSKAYSLAGEIYVSSIFGSQSPDEFEVAKGAAIKAAADTSDAHIQNWVRYVIGWKEFHLGRFDIARDTGRELMQLGRQLNDPRSTGFGLSLLALIAMVTDSYAEALEYSEQSLAVAVTPFDRVTASTCKGCSLVLLRQTEQGAKVLEELRQRSAADGNLIVMAGSDAIMGLIEVFRGNIGRGIRIIEQAILKRDEEGYGPVADWYRFYLCEVYLQIIGANEKLPFPALLKNLPILLKVMMTGPRRIRASMSRVLDGLSWGFVGRAHLVLGILYKIKNNQALAVEHLSEARRVLGQSEPTPTQLRVEAALAELKQ